MICVLGCNDFSLDLVFSLLMDLFLKTKYNAHHPPPQYLTPTYPARIPYQLPLLVNPFTNPLPPPLSSLFHFIIV